MRRAHEPDFFTANRTGAATLLFFHGGYWQRNAKEGFSFVAEGPLAHGFHVAVAGYTLAPEAAMDDIVRQARTALHWLTSRRDVSARRAWSQRGGDRLDLGVVLEHLFVHCRALTPTGPVWSRRWGFLRAILN